MLVLYLGSIIAFLILESQQRINLQRVLSAKSQQRINLQRVLSTKYDHKVYESVALKVPNKAGDMPSLTPPEDENIRTLYVGGIYARVVEQDIRDHFYAYGELESVMMVPQRACAFVTFATRKGAEKAAKELVDNLEIKGMRLKLMWGRLKTPQSVAHNQMVQPPRNAAGQDPRPPPVVHYVNVPLPSPQLGRPPISIRDCSGSSVDPPRTGAVIPSQDEGAVIGSGDGTNASEGVSEGLPNPSIGGEQVEPQTMPPGGAKRLPDPIEAMSPQEMRERVMKRKKGSSTLVGSTIVPPVSPPPGLAATPLGVDVAAQVGSAAEGESLEETPLTRFVTSFSRDFLLDKSTLWPDADTLLFPGPMHLLEKKSNIEIVNEITEMTLKGVQAALMLRRRLLAQLGQQDVWRARLAETEARMSSQIQSLKEAAAAAEARAAAAEVRAAAAVEARKAREALLMTADAQLREMKEKMRLKAEEIQEERKDAASSAALRARATLMREFLDGKSSSWDPQAEIDFYVTHIGEEADLVSKDTPVDNMSDGVGN